MENVKVKVRFSKEEKLIDFDSYNDVVSYMRRKALPWEQVKAKSNMDYKKRVRARVKVAHGRKAYEDFKVYGDKEFIMNLVELGDIVEVTEI